MENVAIYCRLSVDDGTNLESMSISNQKDIITKFVEDNNWNIYDYYIDDGFSGTNFNRPSFERMIEDIKLGYIDIVITKDLSRLGRDYIKTGTFIEEIFPQYNVRYIAISDGVDTKDTIDEMVPFKNIINEFYAKDVSNKIRFTLNNNMKTGKVVKTAIPLYGYMYDENSNRIPDPQTKDIVSRIFDMYIEGNLPAEIAKKFKEEKILTPSYYNYQKYHYGSTNVDKKLSSGPYEWQAESIRRIIKNKEYLGHYIRGKTQTAFKTHKLTVVEEDKRYIFENKFEPLVTQEQFDRANQLLEIVRKRVAKTPNRYAGLAYCAVCGKRLRHKEDFRVSRKNFVRLTCRNTNCTKEAGTILYEDLDKVMVKEIMT